MDVEKVTGQHIQCGIGSQFKPKSFCVVGVGFDMEQFVWTRCLSLDAGCGRHHGFPQQIEHYRGEVWVGPLPLAV